MPIRSRGGFRKGAGFWFGEVRKRGRCHRAEPHTGSCSAGTPAFISAPSRRSETRQSMDVRTSTRPAVSAVNGWLRDSWSSPAGHQWTPCCSTPGRTRLRLRSARSSKFRRRSSNQSWPAWKRILSIGRRQQNGWRPARTNRDDPGVDAGPRRSMVGCPSSEDTAGSALIQFADQRCGCLHVRRVEAFGEPFVDGSQRRAAAALSLGVSSRARLVAAFSSSPFACCARAIAIAR